MTCAKLFCASQHTRTLTYWPYFVASPPNAYGLVTSTVARAETYRQHVSVPTTTLWYAQVCARDNVAGRILALLNVSNAARQLRSLIPLVVQRFGGVPAVIACAPASAPASAAAVAWRPCSRALPRSITIAATTSKNTSKRAT